MSKVLSMGSTSDTLADVQLKHIKILQAPICLKCCLFVIICFAHKIVFSHLSLGEFMFENISKVCMLALCTTDSNKLNNFALIISTITISQS